MVRESERLKEKVFKRNDRVGESERKKCRERERERERGSGV